MTFDLFGFIGESLDDGEKGVISAQKVIDYLAEANGQAVTFRVFTKGGDFFEGSAIHAAISMYDGDVTVKILGLAASAGAFFIMAADKIIMESTAQLMIHNARSGVWGDKNKMRKQADQLETIQQGMVEAFRLKSGMKRDQIEQMLDDETWMGAERAKTLGFVDEIFTAGKEEKVAAKITEQDIKALHYNSVPSELLVTSVSTTNVHNNNQNGNTMEINQITAALGVESPEKVLAEINSLKAKAAVVDDVKAELSTAKARVTELESVEAKYKETQKELEKSKAKELVAKVIEDNAVVLSDNHEQEIMARASEYLEASDQAKKNRIMADMENYVKVNGVQAGSNGVGGSKSRNSFDDGEKSFEAKLDAKANELMSKDNSLNYIDAVNQAQAILANDETAVETVIH